MRIRYGIISIGLAALIIGGIVAMPPGNAATANTQQEKAIFAGGCFWCMEEAFEKINGVSSAVSGYVGGKVANPNYEQVSAGGTGHAEAIEVMYDPSKTSYQELLQVFWKNIDPTTPNQQFCDHGNQYRSAIFYLDDSQKQWAEQSRNTIEETKSFAEPVHTEIVPASEFYLAEDYHQDYYKKNPVKYKFYKWSCGRAQRLEQLWGVS